MNDLLEGRHVDIGPVLIVDFVESRRAVVVDGVGSLHVVDVKDLSVDWHFDAESGHFVSDFAENP